MRLELLRNSVDLTGLAPDVRDGLMRGMEVESIIGLNDISPGFTPAAQTVRIICTPLGVPGSAAGPLLLQAGAKAEDFDKMLMDFQRHWRDRWDQDQAGADGYKFTFPDGLKAFTLVRDNGIPTNQIGVHVRDTCVPGFLHNSSLMGCSCVVTEGQYVDKTVGCSIWIPEKKGRQLTRIGEAVAEVVKQVGKPVMAAVPANGHGAVAQGRGVCLGDKPWHHPRAPPGRFCGAPSKKP